MQTYLSRVNTNIHRHLPVSKGGTRENSGAVTLEIGKPGHDTVTKGALGSFGVKVLEPTDLNPRCGSIKIDMTTRKVDVWR